MELNKKAAYLHGLVDGLGIDDTTKEGKIIKAETICKGGAGLLWLDGDAQLLLADHLVALSLIHI